MKKLFGCSFFAGMLLLGLILMVIVANESQSSSPPSVWEQGLEARLDGRFAEPPVIAVEPIEPVQPTYTYQAEDETAVIILFVIGSALLFLFVAPLLAMGGLYVFSNRRRGKAKRKHDLQYV